MPREVLFGEPENPVELEKALGLARGKVLLMEREGGKISRIIFSDDVSWPDPVLKDKLEKAMGRRTK